jgi:Flp pilus assembly protein TadG
MTRWIQRARALALGSRALLTDIAQADDANVTLITALAIIPALFGLGFTIDYARAEMLQSRINAVADAAALAATDTTYIAKTSTSRRRLRPRSSPRKSPTMPISSIPRPAI